MFQLFDLVITSPVGVYLVNLAENVAYAALIASDCEECGFNDLGKLLFGGLIVALVIGITISLLYRRKRNRDSANTQFVSIRSTKSDN